MKPKMQPSVWPWTSVRMAASSAPRALATRATWRRAVAGLTGVHRPDLEIERVV